MMITRHGVIIRVPVDGIRVIGRNTQGVRVMNLDDGDTLVDVARVVKEDESGQEEPPAARGDADRRGRVTWEPPRRSTLDSHPARRAGAARGRRRPHPAGSGAGLAALLGRPGRAQVRTAPAHRRLQDARRVHRHQPAAPSRSGPRGVITHSSGNHGQAVAYAAKHFGIRAIIVMPADAPAVKVDGVRRHGGEVVFVTDRRPSASRAARSWRPEHGMVMVPPYEHPDVIAGQGTVGLEILEQWPAVRDDRGAGWRWRPDRRDRRRRCGPCGRMSRSWGSSPKARPSWPGRSRRVTRRALASAVSIADGLLPFQIGTLPFEVMRGVVRARGPGVRWRDRRRGQVPARPVSLDVEPSGAAAFAAILAGRIERTGPTVAVVSGGNVDPGTLSSGWCTDERSTQDPRGR